MKTSRKSIAPRYIGITPSGHGHWAVTVRRYNKDVTFTTTNTQAVDAIKNEHTAADVREGHLYTHRQAVAALYAEAR